MKRQRYQNAVHGLKREFIGRLLQMLCVVLPMLLYFFLYRSTFRSFCLDLCYYGRGLFPLVCATGLYKAGKDIGACKKAAALCLADTAILVFSFVFSWGVTWVLNLNIINMTTWFAEGVKWVNRLADIAHCVVMVLSIFWASTAVAKVLEELGAETIAKGSKLVWRMQLAAGMIYLLKVLFPYHVNSNLNRMAVLVSSVFYLRFLYRSYCFLSTQYEVSKIDIEAENINTENVNTENVNMENINMENIEIPELEADQREQNRGIASGLKLFFIAVLGQFIEVVIIMVLVLIIFLGQYTNMVMIGILTIIIVAAGVFNLVGIVGLYKAGKHLRGCSIAFTLACLNLVLIIFAYIPETKTIATILREIFSIAEIYFIITPVVAILKEIGASDIADLGKLVWRLEVIWSLLGICVQPSLTVGIMSVIYLIMFFVVYILYLKFLYNSSYILSA